MKKNKKNDYASFKTTDQGRSKTPIKSFFDLLDLDNVEEEFNIIVEKDFGLTPQRAEVIVSSFVKRTSQLAVKAWSDDLNLQTIEIADIENAKTMQVDEAIEMGNGIWVKRDRNGEVVQLLTEDYELVPPLTKKELEFLNWVMMKGEVLFLEVESENNNLMIEVINNYPESVVLVKPK